MSVLQKLFNFLHSCPKASHFKVRDLNIYFKEAVNPTYKLINLEHIDSLELQVEEDEKNYNLIAYIVKNGKENDILLGVFETRKDAEDGLHQVKNKLFGGSKTLLSIGNNIVLIILYTSFVLSFGSYFNFKKESGQTMPNLSSLSGLGAVKLGDSGGNVNMADMSKLQKQLLQQALQQAGQQGLNVGNMGNIPDLANSPLANSGAAMDNIVAGAIQQAQNQSPVQGQPMPQVTNAPSVQAVEQVKSPGDELLKQIK